MPNIKSKAAIVGTLGPSSSEEEKLRKLIENGLDVVRLNMSHGNIEDHKQRFELVRRVDETIPIIIDLSGPKIRIGEVKENFDLIKDDTIILTKENVVGNREKLSISYNELIDLVDVKDTLFINDGIIELEVTEKFENELNCKVLSGGPISSRKGLNAPGVPIGLFSPTRKDLEDIQNTINLEPDFYSVSFVRRKEDLIKVREQIANFTTERVPLISKIEHQDALDNIDEIINYSDGLMVARGDLGVELPPEDIPLIQEVLVKKSNDAGIPVIVATQMLESMVNSAKPTRAEASDVANAILQGADAVMLSAETATGNHPIEAVGMMERIIKKVEPRLFEKSIELQRYVNSIPDSIGRSAVSMAEALNADVIMAFTRSGGSSQSVAKFRPNQKIIAVTPLDKTSRRLRLQWGVNPLLLSRDFSDTDEMIFQGVNSAYEKGFVDKFDTAVLVAGSLLGLPTSTNLINYIKIDEIINSVGAEKRFIEKKNRKINDV